MRLWLRFFKHSWQYWTRGFSDEVTWNLDKEIAKFVLPRLKRYKEITPCCPSEIEQKEWDEKLDKMIRAFELVLSKDSIDLTRQESYEIKEGMLQFGWYYQYLWW